VFSPLHVILPTSFSFFTTAPANPFDSAREEPEFVEWGYGGMGSVTASRDVCSAVWKGLHSNSGMYSIYSLYLPYSYLHSVTHFTYEYRSSSSTG